MLEKLTDDIKNEFEKIGEKLRKEMLRDFHTLVEGGIKSLRIDLENFVLKQDKSYLQRSKSNLNNVILEQLISGLLGNSSQSPGGQIPNNGQVTANQQLVDIAKNITRNQIRNS